ncbi:MAG: hypothetical protein WB930_16150 [Syntrophobacteraceae bacterium]
MSGSLIDYHPMSSASPTSVPATRCAYDPRNAVLDANPGHFETLLPIFGGGVKSIQSGIMHQLQCQPSQPLLRVGSLPEKTAVARLRLEKVYDLRLEYASYTSRGPVFAFSGQTSIPGVLYNLVPACPP